MSIENKLRKLNAYRNILIHFKEEQEKSISNQEELDKLKVLVLKCNG